MLRFKSCKVIILNPLIPISPRYTSAELSVISEVQLLQIEAVEQWCYREGACELIVVELQLQQSVGETRAECRRDGACEEVVVKVQQLQSGKVAECRRDKARELIVVELQLQQSVGDETRAECRRDGACE